MPTTQSAHLATVWRGTAVEGVIRGHVAVLDSAGGLLGGAGDPDALTTLRSCIKPIQALPLVRVALAGQVDVSDAELAIACASHNGEPAHVQVVLRLLGRAGLGEEALSCGPQLPMDEDAARTILASGRRPGRLTNNCSGKHAGMLAVCSARGLPLAGYAESDHPLQAEIRTLMGELAQVDLETAPVGIDGCGLPTHGLSLRALARMFSAAGERPDFRRCQEAMASHPHLVGGRGRFDSALLDVAGSRVTAKGGAAGVWAAVRRPDGPALAIKLESGDESAISAVALAAMQRLGWISSAEMADPRLADFARPRLHNWEGATVGAIITAGGWLAGLPG